MPAIDANTSASALDMATEIFGPGFVIDGAVYSGDAGSSGTYSNGDTTNPGVLPSDSGVILSTGLVSNFANATGANNQDGGTSTDTAGIDGSTVFNTAAGAFTFDASILEVTFTPEPGQTSLNLEFRFYSEEYNEYVYSNFNDIALVQLDGVTQPISVGSGEISVNGINNAGTVNPSFGDQANDANPGNGVFDSANPNLYIDNTGGIFATEMDGFTVTLSLDIAVTPGVQQTLLIGIADVGDQLWDSSIVIASNNSPDATDNDPVAVDDTGIVLDGLVPETVDLLANDTDPNGQTLTITQINGVGVVANDMVTLNTGQTITLNSDGTITLVNTGENLGQSSFSYTVVDTDGNTDSAFVTFDAVPICFCAGTLIDTTRGPVPVEALGIGDQVLTHDDGPQPIRWIGHRQMAARCAATAPVVFEAGSMGNDWPLQVSPQHRLLQSGHLSELYFGSHEVLAAAIHLINGQTIRQKIGGRVEYFHLMFDRHQIISANGVPSESYQPGAYSLPGLEPVAREGLFDTFPALRLNPVAYSACARPSVKGQMAALLVA